MGVYRNFIPIWRHLEVGRFVAEIKKLMPGTDGAVIAQGDVAFL